MYRSANHRPPSRCLFVPVPLCSCFHHCRLTLPSGMQPELSLSEHQHRALCFEQIFLSDPFLSQVLQPLQALRKQVQLLGGARPFSCGQPHSLQRVATLRSPRKGWRNGNSRAHGAHGARRPDRSGHDAPRSSTSLHDPWLG